MKRRLVTALALVATAVVAMTTFASPAQAGLPGYVKYKTFGWPDACSSAGYYWQQQGLFRYYYCDTVLPAQPASGPGIYDLWVAY